MLKLDEYTIELKDVRVDCKIDDDAKSIEDFCYLYYTLCIENIHTKKSIVFEAYDSPNLRHFKEMMNTIEKSHPIRYGELEYRTSHVFPYFGLEHGVKLEEFNDTETGIKYYAIHIYENFGSSVYIDDLTFGEVRNFSDYIDKKINEAIKHYEEWGEDEL